MKQTIKVTTLLLLVSLLSGCSSSNSACSPAKAAFEKLMAKADKQGKVAKNMQAQGIAAPANNYLAYRASTLADAAQLRVNNQTCFSPIEVVNSQRYIQGFNKYTQSGFSYNLMPDWQG